MGEGALPWGTLFGLLFMTMGPIRAVAVFGSFGESDTAAGVRPLALRVAALVAVAYAVAVVFGDQVLSRWGVGLPALIAAAGLILVVVSLRSMIVPPPATKPQADVALVPAARVAFPDIFPPVAVSIPIIFAAAAPGLGNKLAILGLGLAVVALNWIAMRHAKAILGAIGPTPLQLVGAVFGVLQVALGIEFLLDAWRMA
ncbi:MAG: MarC family protein [Alsobacter sp.]